MFFRSLAVAAALAFTTLTSAVPLSGVSPVHGLAVRDDAVKSVAVIFSEVTVKVAPLTTELTYLTSANATVDIVGGITGQINVALGDALVDIQALIGQPVETILASVDGTVQVTVSELAQIVFGLLEIVFTALGAVLAIVDGTLYSTVFPLLASVGATLGCLICAVISVVDSVVIGLVANLVPLLTNLVSIILSLKLTVVVSVLGL